ncbi:MAG: hypothetical protein H7141_05610 [Burkholderiales bacterium]|nr:hypothetical protein [Bacteroidia bacterium]
MKAHFFLIFLIFNSIFVFSQVKKTPDVFEEAYVVTLKGDTIRGHIKMPKTKKVELFQKISFRDKTNKIRLYTPDKINGYGHNNYYFISAFHDNKSCYFKVLSKGKASLFLTTFEVVDEGIANEVEEFCVMEEKGDGQFKVIDEKGIKKQLKDVFKSNKSLVQKINDQKEIALRADVLENYFNEFNSTASSN